MDSEEDVPQRLALTNQEKDKVGVSVTSSSGVNSVKYDESEDPDALMKCIGREMQKANERICQNVEDKLFTER